MKIAVKKEVEKYLLSICYSVPANLAEAGICWRRIVALLAGFLS